MPWKTQYGSHYHMTQGCHGADIPCDTAGLSPCSDCCGAGSGDGGSGSSVIGAGSGMGGGSGSFAESAKQADRAGSGEATIDDYEGMYDPSMPVRRITETDKATVIEHENGIMEAVVDSSFIEGMAYIPGKDGEWDTITISFSPRYAEEHGLDHRHYAYTGDNVSREMFERIVSSDSVGRAANDLIWDKDTKTVFLQEDGGIPVGTIPRGILAADIGSKGMSGADVPSGPITVTGMIASDDSLTDVEGNISEIRSGKAAPQPVIVMMRKPDDADIRRRLENFGLRPTVDRQGFSDGLERSRHANKFGCFVDGKSPEALRDAKMFLSPDGLTGCAVMADGDIVGVFNANPTKKRAVIPLLELAKQNGGTKMDCYGEDLVHMYESCGYEAVGKIPFNADYIDHDDFNRPLLERQPDVYVLKLRDDPTDTHASTKDELDALPVFGDPETGYDDALAYRDRLLSEQQARQAERKVQQDEGQRG